MKIQHITLLACLTTVLAGCEFGPQSGRGFTLPEGDAEKGREAFTELACNDCHLVEGVDSITQPDDAELTFTLGGKVERIQTYGELVTSIVNPSHKFAKGSTPEMKTETGESKMRQYNEVMTVDQLVHLVAFLQGQYELMPYDPTHYRTYP